MGGIQPKPPRVGRVARRRERGRARGSEGALAVDLRQRVTPEETLPGRPREFPAPRLDVRFRAEREQRAGASFEIEGEFSADEHHGRTELPTGAVPTFAGPGQSPPVRVSWVGGGEDERLR